jgi:hypothetical protein
MNDDHRPDRAEKTIRFGCGFIFLGPAALFLFLSSYPEHPWLVVVAAIAVGAAAGVLAMRFGDRFWERIAPLLHWPWW